MLNITMCFHASCDIALHISSLIHKSIYDTTAVIFDYMKWFNTYTLKAVVAIKNTNNPLHCIYCIS